MKTLCLSLLAALALALPASAQYQGSFATTLTEGVTNTVVGARTNGFLFLDLPRAEFVHLQASFKFHGAPGAGDATTLDLLFFRGVTPDSFETNAWFRWTVAGSGTTMTSTGTNLTVAGTPYLRIRPANVSTNASHVITNLSLIYSFKR